MKRLALFFVLPCLLLCTASLFASTAPNPADYTVTVHVTASRTECPNYGNCIYASLLFLDAVIDGQNLELRGNIQNGRSAASPARLTFNSGEGFLALGDYKAKLMPVNPKDPNVPYYVIKTYEILLSDGRLAEFQVIGQTE